MGWQSKKNGDLLALAQTSFDALLTMDRNIPEQQFLKRFSIGVLIIRASSNRLPDLLPLIPLITQRIPLVEKGCAVILTS